MNGEISLSELTPREFLERRGREAVRIRTFVIGALTLVAGGSMLEVLRIDPIWALVLIIFVSAIVVLDREKAPKPVAEGDNPTNRSRPVQNFQDS
jgi:hypothetical protein